MTQFYEGRGQRKKGQISIPQPNAGLRVNPAHYHASEELVDAVNTAILLGQPLLLTGEPGTGKTQLANSLAWELRLHGPLTFLAKSTSQARDLFYTHDALGRFRAAQARESTAFLDYMTLGALGEAIVRSRPPNETAAVSPPGLKHDRKCRSVVLIDEIDKAPRDFPNDVLHEIERCEFRIPELGGVEVSADPDRAPVVIITSNSEKDLPDAFLRRCIYFDIEFPSRGELETIVASHLGDDTNVDSFLAEALDLFYELREPATGLNKKPATAELLGWLRALGNLAAASDRELHTGELAKRTLGALIKTGRDRERAQAVLAAWTAG